MVQKTIIIFHALNYAVLQVGFQLVPTILCTHFADEETEDMTG